MPKIIEIKRLQKIKIFINLKKPSFTKEEDNIIKKPNNNAIRKRAKKNIKVFSTEFLSNSLKEIFLSNKNSLKYTVTLTKIKLKSRSASEKKNLTKISETEPAIGIAAKIQSSIKYK